jgi:transcriptional regulator with GAF, ATPase, and Fis domain
MAERSELGWARLFAELARELEIACTTEQRLHRIAELATSVTGCTWAAIAMATDHTPVVAATSEPDIGEHIAKLQAAAGGGPTWQAVRTASIVHVPDLITETRWPEHVRELIEKTPVRAILAFCLQLEDQHPLGALTLYSHRPEAFPPRIYQAASVYADHAAIALDHDRTQATADNLKIALQTSREIGVAVGILVERYRVSSQQAFDMLRLASQHTHHKLRHIAEDLVLTGEFNDPR